MEEIKGMEELKKMQKEKIKEFFNAFKKSANEADIFVFTTPFGVYDLTDEIKRSA